MWNNVYSVLIVLIIKSVAVSELVVNIAESKYLGFSKYPTSLNGIEVLIKTAHFIGQFFSVCLSHLICFRSVFLPLVFTTQNNVG